MSDWVISKIFCINLALSLMGRQLDSRSSRFAQGVHFLQCSITAAYSSAVDASIRSLRVRVSAKRMLSNREIAR